MNPDDPHSPALGRRLLVLWIGGCVGALSALWSATSNRFAPPPLDPGGWSAWWNLRDPLDSVAALCRVAASVALGYLALAGLVLLVASLFTSPPLARLATRLNPAPLAGLAGVAAIAVAPPAGASPSQGSDPVADDGAHMVLVQDLPTMRLIDDGIDDAIDDEEQDDVDEPELRSQPRPSPVARSVTDDRPSLTVRVGAGENLWDISQRRVSLALGREPSDAEVHDYWTALIEVNADRFVEPGNPNRIVTGQELVLPG